MKEVETYIEKVFQNIKCIPYNIQLDFIRGAISKNDYKVIRETKGFNKVFTFTYKGNDYLLEVNKVKGHYKREYSLKKVGEA